MLAPVDTRFCYLILYANNHRLIAVSDQDHGGDLKLSQVVQDAGLEYTVDGMPGYHR